MPPRHVEPRKTPFFCRGDRERFGATLVVMGYDNRIGSDGLSSDQLSVLCSGTKMPEFVRLEPKMTCSGTKTPDFVRLPAISSTLIRKVLGEGGIEAAQAMLGYRYELYGVVVAGNRMGRIRDERKFPSLEALRVQLEQDAVACSH